MYVCMYVFWVRFERVKLLTLNLIFLITLLYLPVLRGNKVLLQQRILRIFSFGRFSKFIIITYDNKLPLPFWQDLHLSIPSANNSISTILDPTARRFSFSDSYERFWKVWNVFSINVLLINTREAKTILGVQRLNQTLAKTRLTS